MEMSAKATIVNNLFNIALCLFIRLLYHLFSFGCSVTSVGVMCINVQILCKITFFCGKIILPTTFFLSPPL